MVVRHIENCRCSVLRLCNHLRHRRYLCSRLVAIGYAEFFSIGHVIIFCNKQPKGCEYKALFAIMFCSTYTALFATHNNRCMPLHDLNALREALRALIGGPNGVIRSSVCKVSTMWNIRLHPAHIITLKGITLSK